MQVRTGQDFAAGIMFFLIGLAAFWIGADYPMGTSHRPGTGVLPRILAWCLMGSGAVLIIKAFVSGDVKVGPWAWRPLIAVTLATVVFGMFVDDLGLIVTMLLSMSLCALGTEETKWLEFAKFLVIVMIGSWALFIWLLGMPIPTWPVRFPTAFSWLLGRA
jgi:hypothetical protein